MRRAAALACLLLAFTLAGCTGDGILPRSTEMSEIELILTMGIDVTEDGEAELTLLGGQKSFEGEGGGQQPEVLVSRADTFTMAAKDAGLISDKRVFLGNIEFILVGEEAARRGLGEITDYLIRDKDVRPGTRLCLVKGSAGELIAAQRDKNGLPGRLDALIKNAGERALMFGFTLADAASRQAQGGDMVMPSLLPDGDSVTAFGCGVISKGRLLRFMDKEQTAGYVLGAGLAGGDVIELHGRDGGTAAFDITRLGVRARPVIREGTVRAIRFDLSFRMGLNETTGAVTGKESREYYEREAEALLEGRVRSALDAARGLDVFGVGDRIRAFHPYIWEKIKDDWTELYPALPVFVHADGVFERTYDLKEPLGE